MIRYVEIALGPISHRGKAIPISEIHRLQKYAQEHSQELYRSYYFFDQSLLDHLAHYRTIRGFRGTPFIDMITLDLDKEERTDHNIHECAIGLYEKLKEKEISDINIRPYYSGNGYHFVLPNLWNFQTEDEVKDTLMEQFPECDNIYDKARLIRVANTINFKTQRYKIPLTGNDLLHLSTEEILQRSFTFDNNVDFQPFDFTPHLQLTKVIPKFVFTEQPAMVHQQGLSPIITCMQKLYISKPVLGKRHKSLLRMVSAFKRSGIPRIGIEHLMMQWVNGEMDPGEVRKVISDIYDKNYMYGCHDEVMSEHCDSQCIFYAKKSYNAAIPKNTDDMDDAMKKQHLEHLLKTINLGKYFSLEDSFTLEPEDVVVFQGDTGIGKSALLQNIIVFETSFKILYLNFEVGERLMYRRQLQIAHGKTKQDIIQHYANPQAESLAGVIKHIHMVSDRINIQTFEQLVIGGQYEVLVVDTLECFITPGITEITPKTEYLAHEMKRIAKKYKIIILVIHHISKGAIQDSQGKQKRLNVHSGKGSSAVEQEADKVILIETTRLGENIRKISSAKSRDDAPFSTTMLFDAERTFRFIKEKAWISNQSFTNSSETDSSISPGLEKESLLPLQEGLRLLP